MKHLNLVQRYQIESLTSAGFNKIEIAKKIGVGKSTVGREKKRNADLRNGSYRAELAQRKADGRKASKPKGIRFTKEVGSRVEGLLREDYSPEQVVGHCSKNGLDCVSHERIYQHVWADKKEGGDLHTHLRRRGRKYRKRGSAKDSRGLITNRVSIKERPAVVEGKSRFGDFEADTIIGRNHKGAIVTLNDRASGYFRMKKVVSRKAGEVTAAILELLSPIREFIHTITADNGKEFAGHQTIASTLGIDFYFADPYSSWQRGANENLNGLVRQYIPKKSNFDDYSEEFIGWVNSKINRRPRKRLGFETPLEVARLLTGEPLAFPT